MEYHENITKNSILTLSDKLKFHGFEVLKNDKERILYAHKL
jgi:hypothetical protein